MLRNRVFYNPLFFDLGSQALSENGWPPLRYHVSACSGIKGVLISIKNTNL